MDARSLTRLIPDATASGNAVSAQRSSVPGSLQLDHLHLDRLELAGTKIADDLLIRDSHIGRLGLIDVKVGGSLRLQQCSFESLDLRNVFHREDASLANVRCEEMRLHDVGATSCVGLVVTERLDVFQPRERLHFRTARMAELQVHDVFSPGAVLEFVQVSCEGTARFSSLELEAISIRETTLGRFVVSGATGNTAPLVAIEDTDIAGDLVCRMVEARDGPLVELVDVRVGGTAELRDLVVGGGGAICAMRECRVREDLEIGDHDDVEPQVVRLENSVIAGTLRMERLADGQPAGTRIGLSGVSEVADIYLPTPGRLTLSGIRALTRDLFMRADAASLQAVRRALAHQGRNEEEDAAYYAEQTARFADASGGRRILALVLGQILGWGVRLWVPIRALAFAIVIVALGIYASLALSRGADELLPDGVGRALIWSAGLWVNVSPNLDGAPDGAAYGVVQVLTGALGLLLITVMVGIIIRKLVR